MEKNRELHQLDSNEWGEIYNNSIFEQVVDDLKNGRLSYQSKEMLKISNIGDKILELGCGSGATSVYLAMNGRKVFAVDFSEKSINLTQEIWNKMNVIGGGGICSAYWRM